MVWWVARKGEQVNNNTARCEFCSQNQAAIIMLIQVTWWMKFIFLILQNMTVKNDGGIVEVNSSGESSYACKRPAIVLLALPRGRRSLRDRVTVIRLARSTRPASSTSAFLRAAKLES